MVGASDAFVLLMAGEVGTWQVLAGFMLPSFVGNVLGEPCSSPCWRTRRSARDCDPEPGDIHARPPFSDIATLTALRAAEAACTRCSLYRHATQVVPGRGPRRQVMFVGEQPGDQEDLAGKPFVGLSGRLLDEAWRSGDRPTAVFVTNRVKHFKYVRQGKRRLHQRPNAPEIEACRWWLDTERRLVQPRVVVALGATAARSILGRPVTFSSMRGKTHELDDHSRLLVTVHPSSLLRMRADADRQAAYRHFVADLARCPQLLA